MKKISLGHGKYAIVDDHNYAWLMTFKWHATTGSISYAGTNIRQPSGKFKSVKMHRLIVGALPNELVDHIDGNGHNNLIANLRKCNRQQNSFNSSKRRQNKSGYKGVSWNKAEKTWVAQIKVNNKNFRLGTFDNPLDAAKAYDAHAKELHGEFAKLNFP